MHTREIILRKQIQLLKGHSQWKVNHLPSWHVIKCSQKIEIEELKQPDSRHNSKNFLTKQKKIRLKGTINGLGKQIRKKSSQKTSKISKLYIEMK